MDQTKAEGGTRIQSETKQIERYDNKLICSCLLCSWPNLQRDELSSDDTHRACSVASQTESGTDGNCGTPRVGVQLKRFVTYPLAKSRFSEVPGAASKQSIRGRQQKCVLLVFSRGTWCQK